MICEKGLGNISCKACGKVVCEKCFSKSSDICMSCKAGKSAGAFGTIYS